MGDNEEVPEDVPGFLARRPTLQYVLLAALGVLGVYLSQPLGLEPQSTVEWVDLLINIVILVPSSVLAAAGTVLAVLSGLSPSTLSEESRPARFTRMVLRTVGIPRSIVPDVALLGPIGLLLETFWSKSSEGSLPEESGPEEHADL